MQAVVDGNRPAHLDRCELCARRAMELSRWLGDVKTMAVEAADEVFPAERLAAQQSQIMRRLTQIDEPAQVIEFPRRPVPTNRPGAWRVAPGWLGVAAAAGLVVGVVGGQMAARVPTPDAPVLESQAEAPPTAAPFVPEPASNGPAPGSLLDMDLERSTPQPLQVFDEITPRVVPISYSASVR
jgi:hypothetical protein